MCPTGGALPTPKRNRTRRLPNTPPIAAITTPALHEKAHALSASAAAGCSRSQRPPARPPGNRLGTTGSINSREFSVTSLPVLCCVSLSFLSLRAELGHLLALMPELRLDFCGVRAHCGAGPLPDEGELVVHLQAHLAHEASAQRFDVHKRRGILHGRVGNHLAPAGFVDMRVWGFRDQSRPARDEVRLKRVPRYLRAHPQGRSCFKWKLPPRGICVC